MYGEKVVARYDLPQKSWLGVITPTASSKVGNYASFRKAAKAKRTPQLKWKVKNCNAPQNKIKSAMFWQKSYSWNDMTSFKFICVLYQFHRQTLPITKIDPPFSRVCFNRNPMTSRTYALFSRIGVHSFHEKIRPLYGQRLIESPPPCLSRL